MSTNLTRADAIAKIDNFAGPLSPMRSIDELYESRDRWLTELEPTQAIPILVGLVGHPPLSSQLKASSRDDFGSTLSELLWTVGAKDPVTHLRCIGPLLENHLVRPQAIEAIGDLGDPRGVTLLRDVLRRTDVTSQERRLALDAAREIGGPEAADLLATIHDKQ